MRRYIRLFLPLASLALGSTLGADPSSCVPLAAVDAQSPAFVEGKDYLVLERKRFLDEMGFDQPVEAFSMLVPKGWKSQGGVRWKGVGECRGEIVSNHVQITSPDGKIRFTAMPVRSFGWADEPMLLQAMQAGAQQGGCAINQPFDAKQYIEGFARIDLGAQASDIRTDKDGQSRSKPFDEQANAISRQYGTGSEQTTTMAFGRITWPDGDAGILHVGVTNSITRKPDMLTGRTTMFSSTQVFHCVLMRFAPEREPEATKMMGMFQSSFRSNPIWIEAKDQFLTQLGNIEHAGRMERIRLMGEQSRAYAKSQSDASEQRMRDWESQQASQDRQHTRFVQTIREVESYKEGSGSVELSAGYAQAWSRGNGTYILSNSPSFDPSSVFQDTNWKLLERSDP